MVEYDLLVQYPQIRRKHCLVGFHIDQTPRAGNGRVVRKRIRECQSQKVSQRQGIRRAPRNATFGIQAFKIANHQKPEVDAGGQSRPSHIGRVRLGTDFLDELVELVSHQIGIEVFAERMGRWFRDLTGRNPLFVSLAPVSGASFEGLFEHPGR